MTFLPSCRFVCHNQRRAIIYVQTDQIELSFDRRIKLNTDGQVLEADRCTHNILPRAATFLRPRSSTPTSAYRITDHDLTGRG